MAKLVNETAFRFISSEAYPKNIELKKETTMHIIEVLTIENLLI